MSFTDQMHRNESYCPVVPTASQDVFNRKAASTAHKLWKLKTSQPHLFTNINKANAGHVVSCSSSSFGVGIPGFAPIPGMPGWTFHAERQLFMETATKRFFWHDVDANVYKEFNFADDLSGELSLIGAATTANLNHPPGGAGAGAVIAGQLSSRHLVIMDIHKAAEIFKLDFTHVDRPAAMLAVYKYVKGAVAPEMAAKGLHEKLLRHIASNRSEWSNDDLQAALTKSMNAVATEQKASLGVAGVVALIFGSRLVVAASHGATCAIADALPGDMKDIRIAACSGGVGESGIATACIKLEVQSASCLLLHTEAIDEQEARAAACHAERCHPRAAAAALLQASASAEIGRAAACAHLAWTSDESDEQISKRARFEKESQKEKKVRCRRILLRYTGCKSATDPVRKKTVSRSVAEAEAIVLGLLDTLEESRVRGGASLFEETFTKQCRAISECTSSLKGGDLAGDIGWLKLPEIKPGEKVSKEAAQKMQVINKALNLAISEVSDIIVSEEGVQLMKRAA